jgi:hypothetical protein
MRSGADIAVYSPEQRLELLVEVKKRKDASQEWAAEMRRNLVAHHLLPQATYFLLALPDHLFLWTDGSLPDVRIPDFKIKTSEALGRYIRKTSLKELSEESFGLIVKAWLSDLVGSELTPASAGPELQWLFQSGLYDRIKRGRVQLENS